MFWITLILLGWLIFSFVFTYIIDPVTLTYMRVLNTDTASIQEISEEYIESFGIIIDKPVVYRFVKFKNMDENLLGTFHEWRGKYYIDISIDLYKLASLDDTVIHETRHLMVEHLRDKKIIDLTKYSEEIAYRENYFYNNLFYSGVYLLKTLQK